MCRCCASTKRRPALTSRRTTCCNRRYVSSSTIEPFWRSPIGRPPWSTVTGSWCSVTGRWSSSHHPLNFSTMTNLLFYGFVNSSSWRDIICCWLVNFNYTVCGRSFITFLLVFIFVDASSSDVTCKCDVCKCDVQVWRLQMWRARCDSVACKCFKNQFVCWVLHHLVGQKLFEFW